MRFRRIVRQHRGLERRVGSGGGEPLPFGADTFCSARPETGTKGASRLPRFFGCSVTVAARYETAALPVPGPMRFTRVGRAAGATLPP
jgi:hypothetical protein